jgi:hypothetical protein
VSDLFGFLFLFLIEKETIEDATEENRFSPQDPIVDHQPHAFRCLVSHVVVPCFLLELGRRRQHIEIEFPADPCDSAARFGLRVGPSYSIYSISSEQLIRLVAEAGEELVGLCYFGDQPSREKI